MPAGLENLQPHEVERYVRDDHAFPPYQYHDGYMVISPVGKWQPPTAEMREVIMGFPKDYTLTCWSKAERSKDVRGYELARASLIGNSFHVGCMMWIMSLQLLEWEIISRMPTVAEIADVALPFQLGTAENDTLFEEGPWADFVKSEGAVTLVRYYLGLLGTRGNEVKLLSGVLKHGGGAAQSIDAGQWLWKETMSVLWDILGEHINVLEARAYVLALRWRARTASEHGKRFLHLVDSMVTLGAMCKGRSSSRRMRRVVARASAIIMAAHFVPFLGHVRTDRNPADKPSRRASCKRKTAWSADVTGTHFEGTSVMTEGPGQ